MCNAEAVPVEVVECANQTSKYHRLPAALPAAGCGRQMAPCSHAVNLHAVFAGICNCPDDFNAVCGKNGKTYRNECLMKCADVELGKKGACPASSDPPDAADVRPPKGPGEG
jgi:hypothetical protein